MFQETIIGCLNSKYLSNYAYISLIGDLEMVNWLHLSNAS